MRILASGRLMWVAALVLLAPCAAAADQTRPNDAHALFVRELRALMGALRDESREDAARIHAAYADHSRLRALRDRGALAEALAVGSIRPLPPQPSRLNVRPRLAGAHPIGEKDLAHQPLYV